MRETDDEGAAPRRTKLMYDAARSIGSVLDVRETAQQLADLLIPEMGDVCVVDLHESVLSGTRWPGGPLRSDETIRAAVAGPVTPGMLGPGARLPPVPAQFDVPLPELNRGEIVLITPEQLALSEAEGTLANVSPQGARGSAVIPLFARGSTIGGVTLWNLADRTYSPADLELLQEIASRAALAVDNAQRFVRERATVLALQKQLLPAADPDVIAVDTAARYRPAHHTARDATADGAGGDWFDVIPLSSFRVALVVGDVFGRGLSATAAMGRLRSAVQTLAELDLEPDELLTHLDVLVQRLVAEAGDGAAPLGVTCLYLVYDPLDGTCTVASAGHVPPIMVHPDRPIEPIDVVPGPPLGVGGLPFAVTTTQVPAGTVLALCTDGLLTGTGEDLDAGMSRLRDRLPGILRSSSDDLARACDRALETMNAGAGSDDSVLLLARTRMLAESACAQWEFPARPEIVADARLVVGATLADWGLEHLAFTTELVVTELVTNAMRHAVGPIGLRLLHDGVLVCEVSDPSNTQPRLRRALLTDEGGRGLLLVAQLTDRWGCRYGQQGKTIWTEQALH
ncbi:SpoIIE family protein phosphatase [Yinghuangia sp. ASG 101]|uniref:ATP-binding SpoIIE family protein phosphatase n=1 Tax=Yinghuangia sp. ASG 101 TaxID=2896848 RepID=UPI001E3B2A1F|nr:SpoIIE family protein phosphatase [Yinghuangia sp. ASG 101]UGQ11884.1 SpoIIE family protein phosphatase [Yinghuangia sp. ASG 101]